MIQVELSRIIIDEKRQDQVIVGQDITLPLGSQVDHSGFQVDAGDSRIDETRGAQKGSDREGAMARVQCSGK